MAEKNFFSFRQLQIQIWNILDATNNSLIVRILEETFKIIAVRQFSIFIAKNRQSENTDTINCEKFSNIYLSLLYICTR